MRFVRILLVLLAVAAMTTATTVQAQEYNRFGKGPTTIGFTPPGYGVTSYPRGNVYCTPHRRLRPHPLLQTLRWLQPPRRWANGECSRLSRRRQPPQLPRRRLRRRG